MPDNNRMPTSTQWTRDAVGDEGREAIDSVFQIICPHTQSQGTGFLLDSGYVVTNAHVVEGAVAGGILARSSRGEQVNFSNKTVDPDRDLAVLEPIEDPSGDLRLELDADFDVGAQVSTWGFPLGHSGPSPLLSVGYLSGFSQERTSSGPVKQLVVNGAFNDGNSGGPLFLSEDDGIIGVVVAKHAPFTQFQHSALEALANNRSGVNFTAEDEHGNGQRFSESQLVADLMQRFISLTQVMIGYAVDASELADFLDENDIPYNV
ncbi:serine protease [Saliphagus sp. GCM10025334]